MKAGPDLFNGVPIRFSRDESHALRNLFRHLRKVTDDRYDGWQLEVIANVGKVNKIIHICVHRGAREPDPRQIGMALG